MTKRRANRHLVTAKQKKRAGLVLRDPFQRRVRESKRCAKIRRRHISRQTAIAQWSVDAEKRGDRQGSLLETKKQAVAFLPEGNLESILLIPSSNRGKAKPYWRKRAAETLRVLGMDSPLWNRHRHAAKAAAKAAQALLLLAGIERSNV